MEMATPRELAARGIFNFDTLTAALGEEVEYIIEGLITDRSLTLLAGDSGIGKTPLCVTIALCIAGGAPFLGMRTTRSRRVLYCDAESSKPDFHKLVKRISAHLGYEEVPKNFHVWSPNWDESMKGIDYASALWRNCEWNGFKPEVVFVDPLRVFFPEADKRSEVTMKTIATMRRINGGLTSWVIVHHTRKPSIKQDERPAPIEDDPHRWFQEVAGQHAIVNHVDTRLGAELTPASFENGSEMTMAGFVRSKGAIPPVYLTRTNDDQGEPIGYIRASSLALLRADHQTAFHALPGGGEIFTFKDARRVHGKSEASTDRLIKRLLSIGVIKKVEGVGYVKTQG